MLIMMTSEYIQINLKYLSVVKFFSTEYYLYDKSEKQKHKQIIWWAAEAECLGSHSEANGGLKKQLFWSQT